MKFLHAFLSIVLYAGVLSGCSTVRQTDPAMTATQQLLVSEALDRSARQLQIDFPPGSKVFLDTRYMDQDGGVQYPKYAIAAVSEQLLKLGGHPVATREEADVIVELRSGAQSINNRSSLVGIPSFSIPVPLAGALVIPEVPLYKYHEQVGRAKLAAVAYNRDGGLIAATGPQFGEAKLTNWVLLLVISSSRQEIYPEPKK